MNLKFGLRGEPFVAFVVADVNGDERVFLICRNYTPLGVETLCNNGMFVSYKAPMGTVASRRVGDEVTIRTQGGIKCVTILRKDVFKPKKTGLWDAIDNTLSFGNEEHLVETLRRLLEGAVVSALPLGEIDLDRIDYSLALEGLDEVTEFPKTRISRIAQVIALRDQPILWFPSAFRCNFRS